ncbi:MAG: BatA domain-containing protein, partial [Flavimaricola sp.]|nr:BatA domain-containing protein [Flavimaricola sp.]
MLMLGPLGFTAPWLLLALAALPILWLILRAVPPAPIQRRFPGVALLLGLTDDDTQSDRTPWWLLLLRILAVAAVILGFAGPLLNPQSERTGSGPLLIVADGTWADARDWPARTDRIEALLAEAGRMGR